MEAQLLKQLKAVDDPTPTTAAANFWPAKLHRVDTATLKADIPNFHLLARQFLFGRGFDDRWAGFATKK